MALIFWGSTEVLSDQQTSRFIKPLLRWLMPELSDAAVGRVQYAVRKTGHVLEYGVLAMLLGRALRASRRPGEVTRRVMLMAWGLSVAYAVTDELHQAMVATRYGSVGDVVIDALGAGLGLAVFWRFERRRTRR
jgi:VanZ family protein